MGVRCGLAHKLQELRGAYPADSVERKRFQKIWLLVLGYTPVKATKCAAVVTCKAGFFFKNRRVAIEFSLVLTLLLKQNHLY